jgi:hypothetical protein
LESAPVNEYTPPIFIVLGGSAAQAAARNREKNKTVKMDSNPLFITFTSLLMVSLIGRLPRNLNSSSVKIHPQSAGLYLKPQRRKWGLLPKRASLMSCAAFGCL